VRGEKKHQLSRSKKSTKKPRNSHTLSVLANEYQHFISNISVWWRTWDWNVAI